MQDVIYSAPGGDVRAYLVRPDGNARAVVLWMHWFGEEPNTNRTEFLPDANVSDYDGGHELDAKARADRLAWLREKLGL